MGGVHAHGGDRATSEQPTLGRPKIRRRLGDVRPASIPLHRVRAPPHSVASFAPAAAMAPTRATVGGQMRAMWRRLRADGTPAAVTDVIGAMAVTATLTIVVILVLGGIVEMANG
jgi:hypothetical protein